MSSGSSSVKRSSATTNPKIKDVPTTELKTTGYGGMGYAPTEQTYTAEGKPSWMTGVWDMPEWGTNAATGAQLTQQDLSPQQTTTTTATETPTATSKAKEQYDSDVQSLKDYLDKNYTKKEKTYFMPYSTERSN